MESAVMAPGNMRLKTRVKNQISRNSIAIPKNHVHNKNKHGLKPPKNHINQRQFEKNSSCSSAAEDYVNNGNSKFKLPMKGRFAREVYNAISQRLGGTFPIPEDSIVPSFKEMGLDPTASQVSEMLQCARQCGRRNGASKFITWGEFCVFVREMQNQQSKNGKIPQCKTNNKCGNNCEVFLGGSCNPTTWRTDTAIPELEKHGITFYNPQVSMWIPELVAQEHDAKQAASVLLFVVDSQTRSTVGMIEVAFLVASGRCVVVVAHPYKLGQTIMGETLTQREYRDLVEGQLTLLMLVRSRGIKVHANLTSALQCTARILKNVSNDVTAADQVTNKLRKLREVFDSCAGPNDQMKVLNLPQAFQKLTQRELKTSDLDTYLSSSEVNMASPINFDLFCMLMAELTTNDCDMSTNGWINQSFQRESAANNNCNLDNSFHGNREERTAFDVFLGGTSNSQSSWRQEIAIPILKENNLTFYNPIEPSGFEVLDNTFSRSVTNQEILEWKQIIDTAKVLLFVITNDTRSLTTMILAAHYMGLEKNVVLAIDQLPEASCVINNETLSPQAIKDYNRGRVYLADMARRKQIPIFQDITKAVQCVVDICQQNR